jgi:DNA-binding winged helix-turn-helix (wHTH) protein/TolB-like protein/tetratricopeptide (TPR) repeat protein
VDLNQTNGQTYEFENFRLDSSKRLLLDPEGKNLPLMPKAFEILLYLVTHNARVIGKDELMSAVWPDTIVEENNLTQNISTIRRVLGEKHGENRFIATVPGRGYEFVAEVDTLRDRQVGRAGSSDENVPRSDRPDATSSVPQKAGRFWLTSIAVITLVGLISIGLLLWSGNAFKPDSEIRSLAVLPFKPITAENRDEALEMGMADTLILKLSGEELRVRPLAAVRRFASPEQDPVEAGRQLGVEAVLDGGVQIAGGRVRVSAKLIRVSDGRQIWAGQFDERLGEIFSVQDSISERVATALKVSMASKNRKSYTDNVEAYQLFMKGNFHARRLILPEVQKGISYYEQAIAVDPAYAVAYVELSNAYRAMVLTNDIRPSEMMPKARDAAMKALELDDTLAEAWTALAFCDFWYGWDWKASETHFRRALELDQKSSLAHAFYAHVLSNTGRHEEALAEIKKARELEPLSLIINAIEGQILFFAGREEESTRVLQATIDMDPNFWLAHLFISRNYLAKQAWPEAAAAASKAKEITNGNAEATATSAFVMAKSGRRDEARRTLIELERRAKAGYVPAYVLSLAYLASGDRNAALDQLERAFEQREALMVFLKVEPKWNELRADPRFVDLLKRMNL